ncbi:hypothetical protein DTO027B6_2268 [Paecilomyces variotii]|nr:hypothetical protein DTO027B6_2268 [Paecilomyces variotii]KAJ9390267.1 hypothetical protein DTO032I4_1793 [Paecilomyces variotii]
MGKSKKPRIPNYNHADGPARKSQHPRGNGSGGGGNRKMHTFSKLSTSSGSIAGRGKNNNNHNKNDDSVKPQQSKQDVKVTVPFGKKDRILLVGEGDFSFARSLALHYRCRDILATCYDSKETLSSKYPHVEETIKDFLSTFSGKKVEDSTGEKSPFEETVGKSNDENGDDDEDEEETKQPPKDNNDNPQTHHDKRGPKVLYSVDARKLGSAVGGGKLVRAGFPRRYPQRVAWENAKRGVDNNSHQTTGGPWDVICFNFPHVGGLSTDVNRQVRANQELLVAFFKSCLPLLSTPMDVEGDVDSDEDFGSEYSDDDDDDDDEVDGSDRDRTLKVPAKLDRWKTKMTAPGQIVVTLFEGEPYTLWNIRDLARHAGLRVVTSFKFPWAAYPGYSHARTLGHIEGRDGGRGGWRGEEREARTYVFEIKGNENSKPAKSSVQKGKTGGKKRARDDSDSESP